MTSRPIKQHFRFIDLFAGIGGFHLAMSQLGGECVFASEIDPDCRAVYRRNFPHTRLEGDIKPLTEGRVMRVPKHDVLCAGFPCQPFSKSGFQRGMDEARGTLFCNIVRILKVRRPRYAILENVRNIAGGRQREHGTWDFIIQNLHALGYRVCDKPTVFSPHLLPRNLGGRPQMRDRVFILCERVERNDTTGVVGPPLFKREPAEGWDPAAWRIEDDLLPDAQIRDIELYRLKPHEILWINAWNDFVKGIKDDVLPGFPIWADAFVARRRKVPGTPEWKETWLQKNQEFYIRNRSFIDRWRKRNKIDTFPESRRKLEWQARGCERDLWKLALHLRPSGIRARPLTYLPALVAINQSSVIGPRRRRLTPREAARLQGLPDTFELHPDAATAYKQLGNSVNVGCVQWVARKLLPEHMTCAPSSRAVRATRNGMPPKRRKQTPEPQKRARQPTST